LALLLICLPAKAEVKRSRELNEKAMKFFGNKNYREAARLLLKAHKEFPTPKIHMNLGNCYLEMGEYRKAIRSYEIVLKRVVMGESLRKKIIKLLAKARTKFKQETVQFTIDSTPTGASIATADGLIKGKTKLSDRIKPGKHTVIVQKKGYLPQRREITVPAGLPYTLNVVLKKKLSFGKLNIKSNVPGATIWVGKRKVGISPIKGLLKVKPGMHTVRAKLKGYKSVSQNVSITEGWTTKVVLELSRLVIPKKKKSVPLILKTKKSSGAMTTWKWVTLGLGIAAAMAGTTHALLSFRNFNRLKGDEMDSSRREAVRLHGEQDKLLAIIEYSICGAALITSLTLFLLDRGRPARKGLSFGVAPLPGGAMVTTGFRF